MHIFKMFKYVLTEPRYSFGDRIQYFGTLLVGVAALVLTLQTFLTEKRISFLGLILMSIVLSQAIKLNNKFVIPFKEEFGFTNEAQIKSDLDIMRYMNEVQPNLDRAFAQLMSKIQTTVILFLIVLFGNIGLLLLDFEPSLIFILVGLETLTAFIIIGIILKNYFEYTMELNRDMPKKIRKYTWFLGILVAVAAVIVLVYFF